MSAFQELWTPSVQHILFEYIQYAPLIYGEVFHTLCSLHGWKSNTNYNIATDVQNIQQSINPTPFALWCVLSVEHVLHQRVTAFTNLLILIVTYLSQLQDLAMCFTWVVWKVLGLDDRWQYYRQDFFFLSWYICQKHPREIANHSIKQFVLYSCVKQECCLYPL